MILNEAAVKYMGLKDPVGKTIKSIAYSAFGGRQYSIIGVIKDMIMSSPFDASMPTIYFTQGVNKYFIVRLEPSMEVNDALTRIGAAMQSVVPDMPFDYQFVDQEYAAKVRDGRSSGPACFCVHRACDRHQLFGLVGSCIVRCRASHEGDRIRKVLGASITNLWAMLSSEFVLLVLISCVVASPMSYYILSAGLQNYKYHTDISWWIFVTAAGGALLITLATVSFHAIKSALMNPVKSLRSE
ncbi:MAG: FtsX-like permease family protein [Bacteroidota bacterium]